MNGNACLAREETDYLEDERDLMSLASSNDEAFIKLEGWIMDILILVYPRFLRVVHGSHQTPGFD